MDRWQTIDDLFAAALDRPAEERQSFLAGACGDNAELLRELKALLSSYDDAELALGESATVFGAPIVDGMAGAGDSELPLADGRIGHYRVIREIGRGGMGAVHLAERGDGQFRQQVALKVVKRGMDTDEVLRRFRYERQILASLEHPNIARLLDGGATEEGRPYLVMEYIEGEPIDRYCDTARLALEPRLALLATVCRAVQHAHNALVVHRDIKPSNILVAADGTVKLLDFGIAKLLDETANGSAPLTRTGMRLLTPEHAAPEQIRGGPVTTASDVYALGVLMYQLLAGRRPVERAGRGMAELEQALLLEMPDRPSLAAAQGGETVAAARSATSARLRQRLRGDLDTITLKALAKDPAERYQSAQELLADLERHRAGLPVTARAATPGYRIARFIRRHRFGVTASTAALLLVAGFAAFHSTRITRERDLARDEASKAQAALEFVTGLFRGADPDVAPGDTLNAVELLDRGAERLAGDSGRSPDVQSTLEHAIGSLYFELGAYDRARPLMQRALATRLRVYGSDDERAVTVMRDLGQLYSFAGEAGPADSLYRAAAEALRARGPDGAAGLAVVLNYRGDLLRIDGRFSAADSSYREALRLLETAPGEQREHIAHAKFGLASLSRDEGRLPDAERHLGEVLTLLGERFGPVHTDIANTLVGLGSVYYMQQRHDSAEAVLRRALDMSRTLFGNGHPSVATVLNTLALPVGAAGRFDVSDSLLRQSLAITRAAFGEYHRDVGMGLNNLAWNWVDRGNLDSAEVLFREGLEVVRRGSGEESADAALLHGNLGMVLQQKGALAEAEPHLRSALAARRAAHGEDHPTVAGRETALAELLGERKAYAEAESLFLDAMERWRKLEGDTSGNVTRVQTKLDTLYRRWGRPAPAGRP